MKRYLTICAALTAAVALCGCGDNKTTSKLVGTTVYATTGSNANIGSSGSGSGTVASLTGAQTRAMFTELLAVFNAATTPGTNTLSPARLGAPILKENLGAAQPINKTLTGIGSTSGSVAVTGTFDSATGAVSLTETMSGLQFVSGKVTYTMNGTMTMAGTYNSSASGSAPMIAFTFNAANFQASVGSNAMTLTMNVSLTMLSNYSGSIAGTVNDQNINTTF